MRCDKCLQEREDNFFRTVKRILKNNEEKIYYKEKICKPCLGIKIYGKYKLKENSKRLFSEVKLSKECLTFLEEVKRVRGYVDMLQCFKITHYFTETFDYLELRGMTIEEELSFMLNELYKKKKYDGC